MQKYRKAILLNAGTKTRHAFVEGIDGLPYEWYHTKYMALHIQKDGTPAFIYKNRPIDWSGAFVFTRLRATDQQFCGILYDYFVHEHISANDPINHSYVNSAEKISQMLLLAQNGIPIPETFIFREESFLANKSYLESHLAFPFIYKTDGSKGKNVHYIENEMELIGHLRKKKAHALALIQPFIENEFDTRTIVAFEKVLGSIKRTRKEGHLNNIAQGATASAHMLTKEESDTAIRAAQVCGIDVAGVDMIHTNAKPIILEVNKSPQIHGFESVHAIKVFREVARLMKKE